MKCFENGQTVYHNNEAVRYVTGIDTERALVAVEANGVDSDGDSFCDEQFLVVAMHSLHDKKVDLFTALKARKAEIQANLNALQAKHDKMANRLVVLEPRVKQYDSLKNLFAFIDGKITHFAVSGWKPSILPFDKFVSPHENGRKMRLLSLFGDTDGDLLWKVNQYRDDSGSWCMAIPCLSYEEAQAELLRLVEARISRMGGISEQEEKALDEYGVGSATTLAAIQARKANTKAETEEAIRTYKDKIAALLASMENS